MTVHCLHSSHAPVYPHKEVDATPIGFQFNGREFAYDPDGMRLYACTEGAREELMTYAKCFSTERPHFVKRQPSPPRQVVLTVTHACNLRCAYCFHGTTEIRDSMMTEQTAQAGIDLVAGEEDFGVGFFGGEPLLAFDRIRESVRYAKERAQHFGSRVHFSCTTNGTRLTDEMAQFFHEENFSLIVSLDGPHELHDAARPCADGEGSCERTLTALGKIAQYPPLAARTTLRGTFFSDAPHLTERLIFLNDVADALGLGQVSVEPAFLTEGCAPKENTGANAASPQISTPDSSPSFMKNISMDARYAEAARWCRDRIKQGKPARFHHVMIRARRLYQRIPSPSECGAGCGYITVTPDGSIMACHREGCPIGNVETGIDVQRQAPWCDNRYAARLACETCPWRNICGGGCRVVSLHEHGDVRIPVAEGCRVTDVCIRAAAWLLAELSEEERERLFG